MPGDDFDQDRTMSFTAFVNGTSVSHYKIVNRIGAGGMGEVYLADDTELHRKVALKFLPTRFSNDPKSRARFSREAQAAAILDHDNIVTIYEVSEFRSRPFLSMQYVEGQSLRDLIKTRQLGISQTINLMLQICEGLREAHRSGMVHRDIKPSNIMVNVRLQTNRTSVRIMLNRCKRTQLLCRLFVQHSVVCYSSAEEAIPTLDEETFDLVHLDYDLASTLSGEAIAQHISDRKLCPVVVIHSENPLGVQQIRDILPNAISIPYSRFERKSDAIDRAKAIMSV